MAKASANDRSKLVDLDLIINVSWFGTQTLTRLSKKGGQKRIHRFFGFNFSTGCALLDPCACGTSGFLFESQDLFRAEAMSVFSVGRYIWTTYFPLKGQTLLSSTNQRNECYKNPQIRSSRFEVHV